MSRLYETTDYRRAITEVLEAQGLQQQDLARAIERSKAWLSLMLHGSRPLDPELVEPVAAFLGLDAEEAVYLGALVDLHSRSPRARRAAWATVQATQQQRSAAQLTEDVAATYASWHVAAIAELAQCEGFRADPDWIAATLQPRITRAEASDALTRLVRLGLLVSNEAGSLRPGSPVTWSPSQLPEGPISEAIARLHHDAMGLAQQSIREGFSNERHYSSIVLAVTEERYEALQAALREFERRVVLEVAEAKEAPNRVYLLGMQLFPVSLYTDTEWEGVSDLPDEEDEPLR